jgi:dTDP-4-amino-4,6-dideoxygalactose transaminase
MRVKVASPVVGDDEINRVRDVLLSGNYASGKEVQKFEAEFAEWIGVKHCVAMNSGTAAIQAALAAIDVGPGDEVVVPALTFFSTAMAVMQQGALPIFCDISLDNYCMDPDDLQKRITKDTKAIMPVHFFGHMAEMDEIQAVADGQGRKIHVLEDAAQAHGSMYKDKMSGGIGDMGAFSFFATKHMTTGEGGAVTTNDDAIAEYCMRFRSHGMQGRHDHVHMGYNYRMSEINAAIGLAQMKRVDGLNDSRIEASEKLAKHLAEIDWLTLPKAPQHTKHTYFWFHVEIDEEKLGMSTQDLIKYLSDAGIEVRNRYLEPLYKQPVMNENLPRLVRDQAKAKGYSYKDQHLPNVAKVAGCMIGLPNRPNMPEEKMEYVVKVFRELKP